MRQTARASGVLGAVVQASAACKKIMELPNRRQREKKREAENQHGMKSAKKILAPRRQAKRCDPGVTR